MDCGVEGERLDRTKKVNSGIDGGKKDLYNPLNNIIIIIYIIFNQKQRIFNSLEIVSFLIKPHLSHF